MDNATFPTPGDTSSFRILSRLKFPLGVPGVQNFVWADCFRVGHYATSEWMSEVNYVFPSNYIL